MDCQHWNLPYGHSQEAGCALMTFFSSLCVLMPSSHGSEVLIQGLRDGSVAMSPCGNSRIASLELLVQSPAPILGS